MTEGEKGQKGRPENSRTRPTRRLLLAALIVISFVGFTVSLYLTLMHYQGVVPRCYVVKGCDVVQTSRYSAVLGVPVALLGTMYFALMFYLGIGLTAGRRGWLVLTYKVFAYLGALAAIPLFLLQAVVLKSFCTYCLVIEVLLVATWIATFALESPEISKPGPAPARDLSR